MIISGWVPAECRSGIPEDFRSPLGGRLGLALLILLAVLQAALARADSAAGLTQNGLKGAVVTGTATPSPTGTVGDNQTSSITRHEAGFPLIAPLAIAK